MEPRNRFQGINSASFCSLAGRYDNPIPTRFLAPIYCLKIPAQGCYDLALAVRRFNHYRLDLFHTRLDLIHACSVRRSYFHFLEKKDIIGLTPCDIFRAKEWGKILQIINILFFILKDSDVRLFFCLLCCTKIVKFELHLYICNKN